MGMATTELSFELAPAERDVLADEAAAFARLLPSPEARGRYEALADAARSGVVDAALVPSLEALLDLVLQKRPLAEPVLLGIFQRTPRGVALAQAASDVNRALRSLKGQPLEIVRLSAPHPAVTR